MSFSYRLHVVFICFVPNTGKRLIILGVSVAMHGKQGSTTPDLGIVLDSLTSFPKSVDAQRLGCHRSHPSAWSLANISCLLGSYSNSSSPHTRHPRHRWLHRLHGLLQHLYQQIRPQR